MTYIDYIDIVKQYCFIIKVHLYIRMYVCMYVYIYVSRAHTLSFPLSLALPLSLYLQDSIRLDNKLKLQKLNLQEDSKKSRGEGGVPWSRRHNLVLKYI